MKITTLNLIFYLGEHAFYPVLHAEKSTFSDMRDTKTHGIIKIRGDERLKTSLIKKIRIICTGFICLVLCLIIVRLEGVKQDTINHLVEIDEVRCEAKHEKRAEVKLSMKSSPQDTFNRQTSPQYETAILERFEEKDKAIILFEELEQEFIIPKQMLPNQADINTWFDVWMDPGQNIIILSINKNKTKQDHERAKCLHNRLRNKR